MTPRPSSLDRVAACPGSYAESIGKPSLGSDDTANGNALHWIIAQAIYNASPPSKELVEAGIIAHSADCDADEMLEAATWAVQYARSFDGYAAVAEEPVGHGTVDLELTRLDDTWTVEDAIVIDWKGARKEGERTEDRLQLLDYATATASRYGLGTVRVGVAYPFLKKVDLITLNREQIIEYADAIEDIRIRAMEMVDKPVDRRDYRAGDWCKYCPGKATCPALRAQVAEVAALIGASTQLTLTPEQLPAVWQWKTRIENVIKDLKDVAMRTLESTEGGKIESDVGTLSIQTRKNSVKLTFDDAVTWLTEHGHGGVVEVMAKDITESKPVPPPSVFPTFRAKKPTKSLTTDV